MMRTFILTMMVFGWGCQGNTHKPMLSKADTLKLYDPYPDTILTNPFELFKNCIAMRDNTVMMVANGIQRNIDAEASLEKLITIYADSLKRRKLYILCDNSIPFDKIATTIGYLKAKTIHNYKVVRMDTVMKLDEPLIIKPPSLSPQKLPTNDSNHFLISILGKRIEMKHAGIVKRVPNIAGLDALLQQYPKPSDSTAIIIQAAPSTTLNKVMSIMQLLKKRGFVRISLSTSN